MSKRKGFSGVRTSVDGSDGFVGGHQVISTAGATKHAERMKRVPVWALDDEKIQQLIRTRYPKISQREKAAKLLRIIYLYYREGSTAQAIAEQLNASVGSVEMTLYRLTKKQGVSGRKGRKKKSVSIETPSGEVNL